MKLELFYDFLHVNCCAYGVQIENMSIGLPFMSNKLVTAMTSQGHVTTASP